MTSLLPWYKFCPYDQQELVCDLQVNEGHPTCQQCGFVDYQNPRPCVAVLLVRNNQVLLAERGINPRIGMWDIPGGFIKSRQTAEEAVASEMKEETGLEVTVKEFLGSLNDKYDKLSFRTLNLCFLGEIQGGVMKAGSDVASLRWFSMHELPEEMAFEHQHQMLAWLRNRLNQTP